MLDENGKFILKNVSRETKERLLFYSKFVMIWNERINLTASKNVETFYQEHVMDALASLSALPPSPLWIDVGTGPGLPGIVWGLVSPSSKIILVESSQKKAAFLHRVKSEFRLDYVSVIDGRFENVGDQILGLASNLPPVFVSRGTASPENLLSIMTKAEIPWLRWIVFSSQRTHDEFSEKAPSFDISVDKIIYGLREKFSDSQAKILTVLTRQKKSLK